MKFKIRLDQRLVDLSLVKSRSYAQSFIIAGLARVNGRIITKSGYAVTQDDLIEVIAPKVSFVSRGGVKLAGALNYFQLNVTNFICLDVGASTGGFTDCLLQHGAMNVIAIDVGYGQLAYKLRLDPRVTFIERVNARYLTPNQIPGPFDLIVGDLSFISLTIVLPILIPRLSFGGYLLCLVKPQFEVNRKLVGKGGIVYDKEIQLAAVEKVRQCLLFLNLKVLGSYISPITGRRGNKEYFILSEKA